MARKIDTDAIIESVRLEEQASAPISPDAGFTHVWAKSDGLYIVNDSDEEIGPFITGSAVAGGHSTGTMTIYRDDVHLGVFDEIRFNGSVGAWSSGTYAAVDYDGIGAHVYNSGNISVADSSNVIMTFDSERYDTDGIHDVGSDTERLTCKTAGKYFIHFTGHWDTNAVGFRRFDIKLNVGGTVIGKSVFNQDEAVGVVHTVSTEYDLVIGDYVFINAVQTSGDTININASPNFSPEFFMRRVG